VKEAVMVEPATQTGAPGDVSTALAILARLYALVVNLPADERLAMAKRVYRVVDRAVRQGQEKPKAPYLSRQ
jgi:mannose-1-phosphate guanylyltransferase